jgi:hypothetical protein
MVSAPDYVIIFPAGSKVYLLAHHQKMCSAIYTKRNLYFLCAIVKHRLLHSTLGNVEKTQVNRQ